MINISMDCQWCFNHLSKPSQLNRYQMTLQCQIRKSAQASSLIMNYDCFHSFTSVLQNSAMNLIYSSSTSIMLLSLTCNPQRGGTAVTNEGIGSECLPANFHWGRCNLKHVSPTQLYQHLFPLSGRKQVLSKLSDTCQQLPPPTLLANRRKKNIRPIRKG